MNELRWLSGPVSPLVTPVAGIRTRRTGEEGHQEHSVLPHTFGFRTLDFRACLFLPGIFFGAIALVAATNDPDAIPPLLPPRGEIGPTFWEEHGFAVAVSAVVCLLLLAVVVWFLTRPKPSVVLSPAALARQTLEPLRSQAEDGALLSRVSQTLRHYLATAFELPPGEFTTAEFCQALSASPRPGAELTREVIDFLRGCDERKFAPPAPSGSPGALEAAHRSLRLIDRVEVRLAELRAAQAVHSAPPTKPS